MWLYKKDSLYWIDIEAYVKIIWMNILEKWEDENGKIYSVCGIVNYYTDDTKANLYKQTTENFELRESELTLTNAYEKLLLVINNKDVSTIPTEEI